MNSFKLRKQNIITGLLLILFFCLQFWIIINQQLFGDEAFYWLEGQHLGLSYSELPGWTAWMIRLGVELFGDNYFAVRIFSYLAFISIFYPVILINKSLANSNQNSQSININLLLLLAIPIYLLIAVMALPDIWLVFFVMWISYFLIKASQYNKTKDWLIAGVLLACSINVHVRMWIWLFFAGLAFVFYFHSQHKILRPALLISLPIALLGLLPIAIFNYQNDFALFVFQFGSRHPWQFQLSNFSFLASQILVVTPLVLYLWFSHVFKLKKYSKKQPIVAWILLTALLHWLMYVIMSLFADGLRTTVHWVIISYVPVLAISSLLNKNKKLINWSIVTGTLVSLSMFLLMVFQKQHNSNWQTRLFDNSSGWHELATAVKRIQKQQNIDDLIADYFMTGAELAFELDKPGSIKVLPHDKNTKHGRQKQLQIMGLLMEKPQEFQQKALLIVEDSTLKLQDKGRYYSQLCENFSSLKYLETVTMTDSNKQFYVFVVNESGQELEVCEIPPIFYIQHTLQEDKIIISGWALFHTQGIRSLAVIADDKNIALSFKSLQNKGLPKLFPEIDDPNYPNNGFEVSIPFTQFKDNQFRIMAIGNDDRKYISKIVYLD